MGINVTIYCIYTVYAVLSRNPSNATKANNGNVQSSKCVAQLRSRVKHLVGHLHVCIYVGCCVSWNIDVIRYYDNCDKLNE